jgi:cardiolipin synthase
MLDPIADKLLVSAILLLLAADGTIAGWRSGRRHHPVPRDPGFGPARISRLTEGQRAGHLACQVEDRRSRSWRIGFLLAGPAGDKVLPYTTETGMCCCGLRRSSRFTPAMTISAPG